MATSRVVVTGVGAVTPIGLNSEEFWAGLSAGKSGVGLITRWDASVYPAKLAAEIKGFDPLAYMDVKTAERTGRFTHHAIAATIQALRMAGLDIKQTNTERVGVVIATTGEVYSIGEATEVMKAKGPRRIDPLFINRIAAHMAPVQVARFIGAKGPNSSINSACASGSDALGTALNRMRLGHADVMLAGATDTVIAPLAIATMGLLGALCKDTTPERAPRPFDKERNGFVTGEGAGMLVLETYEHAMRRGAKPVAELAGVGWSFDAHNDVAPDAEGEAICMRAALRDAGMSPDEIDYINAHGTGTRLNDASETKAVKLVFGERAYKIPMSSTKSMIGHLACGAGGVEAVATVLTIMNGVIPPTINYRTPDPECDLDYVPNIARKQQVSAALSNNFGLGGQDCAIVIKRFAA
jgi:3-oxoacyl-[acyl-carrier-protein] synthase II